VSLYRHLPPELRDQLHGDIQVFLAEKRFEGAGGLEMTEEIRVTVAGEACMLLLNRENRDYPGLVSIVVYPGAFLRRDHRNLGGAALENEAVLAGESWHAGTLVLSWDHVKRDAAYAGDGHNVVLHEFAHQLDQEDGRSDGAPLLEKRSSYRDWARILGAEYAKLREDVRNNRKNVMDAYGATNPAEFFAVATETFFDKPLQLKRKEPELYEELKSYYRVDPAAWQESGDGVNKA